jgi:hypothetical protein
MQYGKKRKSSVELIKIVQKNKKQKNPPTHHTPISKERKKKEMPLIPEYIRTNYTFIFFPINTLYGPLSYYASI